MTTHGTTYTRPTVNSFESPMTSRMRDIVRMNPLIFLGSKVGEDSQEFIHSLYKVLSAMSVTSTEKGVSFRPIEGG